MTLSSVRASFTLKSLKIETENERTVRRPTTASHSRGRPRINAPLSWLMRTREIRENTPAASIALAKTVLPPSESGSIRRRQMSPAERMTSRVGNLRTFEATLPDGAVSGAAPGLRDPVFFCLVAEGAEADLQQLGGARLGPPRTLESLEHQVLLDVGDSRVQLDPFRWKGDGDAPRRPTPMIPFPDLQGQAHRGQLIRRFEG